jgi:hypothetical protein
MPHAISRSSSVQLKYIPNREQDCGAINPATVSSTTEAYWSHPTPSQVNSNLQGQIQGGAGGKLYWFVTKIAAQVVNHTITRVGSREGSNECDHVFPSFLKFWMRLQYYICLQDVFQVTQITTIQLMVNLVTAV